MLRALEIALASVRFPDEVCIVTSPLFEVVTPLAPSPTVRDRPLLTLRLPPTEAVKIPMLLALLSVAAPATVKSNFSVETALFAIWVRSPTVVVIVTEDP